MFRDDDEEDENGIRLVMFYMCSRSGVERAHWLSSCFQEETLLENVFWFMKLKCPR